MIGIAKYNLLPRLFLLGSIFVVSFCNTDSVNNYDNDDTDTGSDPDAGDDSGTDDCQETANGTLPNDITVLSHDENDGTISILDGSAGSLTSDDGTFAIGEEPMWEAVRFQLDAPTTVYGVRLQWDNILNEDPEPVSFGLYDDFSSNGFDFYQWGSLVEGTRCLSAAHEGSWVDYVFETPVEMTDPGLIYAAHFWNDDNDPALLYNSATVTCDGWDYWNCTSALNMPQAASEQYNGMSSYFWHHYAVRLLVQIHDDIPAKDKWFQADDSVLVGSRVAWGDYDNDGDDDIMTDGPVLYRNNGDGSFAEVTEDANLDATLGPSGGGVFGDFNNDGCLDYIGQSVVIESQDILLKNNCDGTFTDVTLSSGITDFQDYQNCSSSVDPEYSPTDAIAWLDIDSDGYLDVYMAEYECWQYDWTKRYIDRVWHNEGDGTFTEWTDGHGFNSGSDEVGRGLAPLDYDLDGDVDLFVANYRLNPNFFYKNNGDGTVTDVAETSELIGVETSGYYGLTNGPAWLDVENDGDWDILLPHLAHPRYYDISDLSRLMINNGFGVFEDTGAESGIYYRETHYNGTTQDFNNDGYTDFFITSYYESRFSEIYLNNGDGSFDQVNYESGLVVTNAFGSAGSDYDNDGDVDMVCGQLWRNDSAAEGNNWLQVRTLGGIGNSGLVNAAGIGSVVKVTIGDTTLMNHTDGATGAGNQDSAFLNFGLGEATEVDTIDVLYPGGSTVSVSGPIDGNQRVWIKADGIVSYGWTPPE